MNKKNGESDLSIRNFCYPMRRKKHIVVVDGYGKMVCLPGEDGRQCDDKD